MPQFDPRHAPARYAPAVLGGACVLAAALGGLGLAARAAHATVQAFATTPRPAPADGAQPGFSPAVSTEIEVRPGETLTAAVVRTGVDFDEAREVVATLSGAFDTVNIKAGLTFQAEVAHPRNRPGAMRLMGLSLQTGPASAVTLARGPDGALNLSAAAEKLVEETHVASGAMDGSLYESALKAGASPTVVAEATKLFAKKLDFARDIQPGDPFRLAFDRTATAAGKTVATGDLLYAEVGAKGRTTRFYRFEYDGRTQFLDEVGQEMKALLIKTPLEDAHVTSSYGMRLHPLLGYTRLHPGVDFGAPTGTPVFAAGDGVVEEARWAGGYGHWLKLKHAMGWETGYGHLSRYAPGIRPGAHVTQGQVVAFVGSTGLSTGPHLHYEIMRSGAKIDPRSVRIPQEGLLNAAEIADFKAQRAKIDAILAAPAAAPQALAARAPNPPALRRGA